MRMLTAYRGSQQNANTVQRRTEEDADVDGVQRQPAEREHDDDDNQHLYDAYLRSVDDLFV